MRRQKQIEQFAKLTAYILGRRPDEFGLVPDAEGFFSIKEFLKAVNETEGWRHIRQSHIHEMMLSAIEPPVEIQENKIRARQRDRLPRTTSCQDPPKILFACVTEKSYSTVIQEGISPTFFSHVVCTTDKEMAQRIGKRRDARPVLLTVQARKAADSGVQFYQAGEGIYLAGFIPPDCFTGPPAPKPSEKEKKPEPVEAYKQRALAGSFMLSPNNRKTAKNGSQKEKRGDWKRNKKRLRKEKKQLWPA